MAKAYESASGNLADRMLAALDAAQAEGGDIRGKQSAAMLVVGGKPLDHPWKGIVIDLRVEDHPEPLVELRRLLTIQRAYQAMNLGDEMLAAGNSQAAFEAYDQAAKLAPQIDELIFWQAVTLADTGNVEKSLPVFKRVFTQNPDWAELLQRLPSAGLFKDDPELMKLILAQK